MKLLQHSGGGGPWGGGGGGHGPWGRGPGGPQGPDFEDLLRQGQERFKRYLPGGVGGSRGIILLILAALALWIVSGSFYRVQPDEQGVVLRFGRYVYSTDPGLHIKMPPPIETVFTPSVTRINRIEVGVRTGGEVSRGGSQRDVPEESLMLTGDQNIVDIHYTVFWRIKDAGKYLFNIRNPEATVKIAAESVMREVIGQTPIQSALTEGRQKIEERTLSGLQALLDLYGGGIEVRRVQLLSIEPPGPVNDAFIDVQRAQQDQDRAVNEAESYSNDIIPRARGDAQKIVLDAQAYKEAEVNRAQGDAQRFLKSLDGYSVNKEVTMQRLYLETLEDIFQGMNKLLIDSKDASGLVPYLPLRELAPRAPQPATAPVTSVPSTAAPQRQPNAGSGGGR
jgi:membrane protease subunit HflK